MNISKKDGLFEILASRAEVSELLAGLRSAAQNGQQEDEEINEAMRDIIISVLGVFS